MRDLRCDAARRRRRDDATTTRRRRGGDDSLAARHPHSRCRAPKRPHSRCRAPRRPHSRCSPCKRPHSRCSPPRPSQCRCRFPCALSRCSPSGLTVAAAPRCSLRCSPQALTVAAASRAPCPQCPPAHDSRQVPSQSLQASPCLRRSCSPQVPQPRCSAQAAAPASLQTFTLQPPSLTGLTHS